MFSKINFVVLSQPEILTILYRNAAREYLIHRNYFLTYLVLDRSQLLMFSTLIAEYAKQGLCIGPASVCPSVPSSLRVCCCAPGGQEISIDCCTAGAQQQWRRSSKCEQCHVHKRQRRRGRRGRDPPIFDLQGSSCVDDPPIF